MVMRMVRFHQHDRCLRMGVLETDLILFVFVIEYSRLFPNIFRIPQYSKSVILLSQFVSLNGSEAADKI